VIFDFPSEPLIIREEDGKIYKDLKAAFLNDAVKETSLYRTFGVIPPGSKMRQDLYNRPCRNTETVHYVKESKTGKYYLVFANKEDEKNTIIEITDPKELEFCEGINEKGYFDGYADDPFKDCGYDGGPDQRSKQSEEIVRSHGKKVSRNYPEPVPQPWKEGTRDFTLSVIDFMRQHCQAQGKGDLFKMIGQDFLRFRLRCDKKDIGFRKMAYAAVTTMGIPPDKETERSFGEDFVIKTEGEYNTYFDEFMRLNLLFTPSGIAFFISAVLNGGNKKLINKYGEMLKYLAIAIKDVELLDRIHKTDVVRFTIADVWFLDFFVEVPAGQQDRLELWLTIRVEQDRLYPGVVFSTQCCKAGETRELDVNKGEVFLVRLEKGNAPELQYSYYFFYIDLNERKVRTIIEDTKVENLCHSFFSVHPSTTKTPPANAMVRQKICEILSADEKDQERSLPFSVPGKDISSTGRFIPTHEGLMKVIAKFLHVPYNKVFEESIFEDALAEQAGVTLASDYEPFFLSIPETREVVFHLKFKKDVDIDTFCNHYETNYTGLILLTEKEAHRKVKIYMNTEVLYHDIVLPMGNTNTEEVNKAVKLLASSITKTLAKDRPPKEKEKAVQQHT